jgi:hypothetical protein
MQELSNTPESSAMTNRIRSFTLFLSCKRCVLYCRRWYTLSFERYLTKQRAHQLLTAKSPYEMIVDAIVFHFMPADTASNDAIAWRSPAAFVPIFSICIKYARTALEWPTQPHARSKWYAIRIVAILRMLRHVCPTPFFESSFQFRDLASQVHPLNESFIFNALCHLRYCSCVSWGFQRYVVLFEVSVGFDCGPSLALAIVFALCLLT